MLHFAALLALFWGALWALFLQYTDHGRFLALRRTWIAVVIGVGGDLLILVAILPFEAWLVVCGILTASSIGIIARSLINEHADDRALLEVLDE